MICKKCNIELPDKAIYCYICGQKLIRERRNKKRGNGQGTVYVKKGIIIAVKTLGYETDDNNKKHRKTLSKQGFATKREAYEWLALPSKKREKRITFKKLYETWAPTHTASKSTMNCYNAAMNYFKPLWYTNAVDIDIDDLQECVDECDKGKQTRRNMKTLAGLLYKYGIPRGYFPEKLNLAEYIIVGGGEQRHKSGFTDAELEIIRKGIGRAPYADWIYCLCYLGFRPSEFLELDALNYNRKEKAFVGGKKTEAGTNRTVTISPKIQPIIDNLVKDKISGPIFCRSDGGKMDIKEFREHFYKALDALHIDNPTTKIGNQEMHKLTPHSCRHTFATMLKRVDGGDKDKLELIGHTSAEMLRYYQDVEFSDLRKITDAL
jgi:integrase/ribosomal protein L40E